MASKEIRTKRQKALEAPREPRRPKTHWDHVLEEMAWLSKDFEAERKWKLSQAKKVALRASKGMLDQATRGERRIKEEEQRVRKVALNISKDVKKFWLKIEKLVLYKHQLALEAKKQKARDKQLEFLLGQTERYSNMLAENLVNMNKPAQICVSQAHESCSGEEINGSDRKERRELNIEPLSDKLDNDGDFNILSEDDLEDDEHTLEEDEALITEKERQEELEALQVEMDLPIEELLKRYAPVEARQGISPMKTENGVVEIEFEESHQNGRGDYPFSSSQSDPGSSPSVSGRRCGERHDLLSAVDNHVSDVEMSEAANVSEDSGDPDNDDMVYDFSGDDQEDGEFFLGNGEEKDDEATMEEEEELAKKDSSSHVDEIAMLQKESEIPIEELLARYKEDLAKEYSEDESERVFTSSGDMVSTPPGGITGVKKQVDDVKGVQSTEHEPVVNSDMEGREAVIVEETDNMREGEDRIADAAAAARSAQPTGITFSTTKVRTKFPFLLKYPLREYQHIGLDWLVTMYEKRLNGILADEMGLGKTIMTISLLAHLACEKGIWGPHLIVVPTSVMLNWETEFLKWCPAFKILTYFGTAKERKLKRQGWLKPNSFHVCITTYRLVIQDSKVFKRKKWKYLILDEAHLIKNWKSQRWQTLLNFNSKRRILLTGTPLQNDLMELWSLMHFLMPHIFQSHQEFKDWFCNPIAEMVEGQEKVNREVIDRLHNVLRPFILRRLKRDVEKQLPMKHEHVIYCRLSKRQRTLYEDFISSSETQATLASANFFGMISVIMQLRKVCNHPDLFEGRPIISSYDMRGIDIQLSSSVCSILSAGPFSRVDLKGLGYIFSHLDLSMCSWESDEVEAIATPSYVIMERPSLDIYKVGPRSKQQNMPCTSIFEEIRKAIMEERLKETKEHAASIAWWNSMRCRRKSIYPTTLRELVTIRHPVDVILRQKTDRITYLYSSNLADAILTPVERFKKMIEVIGSFMFVIPPARAPTPVCWCSKSGTSVFLPLTYREICTKVLLPLLSPVRPAIVRRQVYFPDRRLIQFDCGKLQELALLLRRLKSQGHRALIFTQMTKMLDILEAFINLYGYTYMRLDGSTQPEERQTLMQRFNTNPKIFLFILSTRSGGVGINLVGADTVIFYDSDWNPAMDQQAQDRCHRIGQTREVHIYRLISEKTIEENILKKANQKRALDDLVIQSGSYNTEFFKKLDPMELFSDHQALTAKNMQRGKNLNSVTEVSVSNADVEAALQQAEDEADYMALKKVEHEEAVDNQEFTEETIGKLEDDDLANEDDLKGDEPADQGGWISNPNKNGGLTLDGTDHKAERSLVLAGKDDDVDLLADVKQMAAAAAAAGQEISSFENQLRPLDRYAMRLLELWDPIIDKAAIHSEVKFEEKEWELDRIEKYKEEMEAEMDEDEEPLVYERWDADFATEAYRHQVEVLAQHQLMEELEYEAKMKEAANDENISQGNAMHSNRKQKSKKKKKKAKKTKFKSLKKRTLASKTMPVKEEPSLETMSFDDDLTSIEGSDFDVESTQTAALRKRKKTESSRDLEEMKHLKKKLKKTKNASAEIYNQEKVSDLSGGQHDEALEIRSCETIIVDSEAKTPNRSRAGGKISIVPMPLKRILMIRPEKTKKGNMLSKDCVPSPDSWVSQEDAVLCAVVHEYGPNWSLVSDALYGMTAGGSYRGRYRHPVHCCDRFRELVQRYVLYPTENLNTEKASTSGKALLKVTEDNIQMLLDLASEMEDDELLLQNHFSALISSVWRVSTHTEHRHDITSLPNGFCLKERYSGRTGHLSLNTSQGTTGKKLTKFGNCSNLVQAALRDASNKHQVGNISASNQEEEMSHAVESMDISLEIQGDEGDFVCKFPPSVNVKVFGWDPSPSLYRATAEDKHLKPFSSMAEHRSRQSARTCIEDSGRWALSAFSTNDIKVCSSSKQQTLCKHKLSNLDSVKLSKSKSRRTIVEHCGSYPPVSELIHQLNLNVSAKDQHLGLDLPTVAPPMIPDVEACDTDYDIYDDVIWNLPLDTESSYLVPHNYMPDLISGLEDCSYLPDYIDIG